MNTPAATPRARLRVVLVAEQRLVGEAVRVALDSRGLDVATVPWVQGRRAAGEHRRRIATIRPLVGVMIGGLDRARRREEALELVRAAPLRWAVLVEHPEEPVWGPLAMAGIAALMSTSVSLDDLVHTLGGLATGQVAMSDAARIALVASWEHARAEERLAAEQVDLLTPRELAVLGLLYDGKTVLSIAEQTGVSEQTVRSQVKSVLRKLSVSSQLAAVAVYRRASSWRLSTTDEL